MKRKIETEIECINEKAFEELAKDLESWFYPFQGKKVKVTIDIREVKE